MADWLGIFDTLFSAINATRSASNSEPEKGDETEKVEETVKKRADAIVEKRLDEIEERRKNSQRLSHQDHHRTKR